MVRDHVARLGSVRELRATAGVALLACALEIALRTMRLPQIVAALGVSMAHGEGASSGAARLRLSEAERRRVRAVARVLRRWRGGGTCLRTALLYAHALRDRTPIVLLGVRHGDGGIEAHAWVEVDGQSLGNEGGFLPLGEESPHP